MTPELIASVGRMGDTDWAEWHAAYARQGSGLGDRLSCVREHIRRHLDVGDSRGGASYMILPKVRDPRLITVRRGGTLSDADHRLLGPGAFTAAADVIRPRHPVRPARARG